MTPITYANPPTRRETTARFSASARPIPRASRSRRMRPHWMHDPRFAWADATTTERGKITAAVAATFVLIVLLVLAPPAVTMPILVVLATALIAGGLFRLVARWTRPFPAAPGTPDHLTRRTP